MWRVVGSVAWEANLRDVGTVPPIREYLRDLWFRRDFVWLVPLGQLRAQTQNTLVGGLWHLLNPVLTALMYYIIFGLLFNASEKVENYPAFLVVGIFTFLYSSRMISAGSRSIMANMGIISQIKFPRLALPLAAGIAETVSHAIALVSLLLILPALGSPPSYWWFGLLLTFPLQAIFNLGVAMMAARITFQFRDMENLIPHALRFWMYASGVFYTLTFVEEAIGSGHPLAWAFQINPLYIYISLMRACLLEGGGFDLWLVWGGAAWACAAVFFGARYFRGMEVQYGRGA